MSDPFLNILSQTNPSYRWVLLAASASVIPRPRSIICTVAGNITMEDAFATVLTLTAPPVNQVIPLAPIKVTAVTGTFYGLY